MATALLVVSACSRSVLLEFCTCRAVVELLRFLTSSEPLLLKLSSIEALDPFQLSTSRRSEVWPLAPWITAATALVAELLRLMLAPVCTVVEFWM
jgi:hypothetical protein